MPVGDLPAINGVPDSLQFGERRVFVYLKTVLGGQAFDAIGIFVKRDMHQANVGIVLPEAFQKRDGPVVNRIVRQEIDALAACASGRIIARTSERRRGRMKGKRFRHF